MIADDVLVIAAGLKEKTAYHCWVGDDYRGLIQTWYPPGLIVLEVPEFSLVRFMNVADTTITGIQPLPTTTRAVRPNPFEDHIYVDGPGVLVVYDVTGRQVIKQRIPTGTIRINAELPSGVYFWRIGSKIGKITRVK